MGVLSGPFLIAVVLLVAAGGAKAFDPTMTVGALAAFGLPIPAPAVRAFGALEALLAIAAVLTGAPVLVLGVAASYLAFAGFVVIARVRRLPIGTCGCFGRADTPPSALHVALNLAAAASAVAVAMHSDGGLVATLRTQPLAGVPFLALGAVGAYAAITALTVVPALARISSETRSRT